jgi:hypothetical protein
MPPAYFSKSNHGAGMSGFMHLFLKVDSLQMKGGEKSMATKKAPAKKAKKTTKKK